VSQLISELLLLYQSDAQNAMQNSNKIGGMPTTGMRPVISHTLVTLPYTNHANSTIFHQLDCPALLGA